MSKNSDDESAGKVRSLFGEEVPLPGEPAPDIVERLTDMLERAKTGELRAIGVVSIRGNGRPSVYLKEDPNVDASIFVLHSGIHCLADLAMEVMAFRTPPQDQEDDEDDDDA